MNEKVKKIIITSCRILLLALILMFCTAFIANTCSHTNQFIKQVPLVCRQLISGVSEHRQFPQESGTNLDFVNREVVDVIIEIGVLDVVGQTEENPDIEIEQMNELIETDLEESVVDGVINDVDQEYEEQSTRPTHESTNNNGSEKVEDKEPEPEPDPEVEPEPETTEPPAQTEQPTQTEQSTQPNQNTQTENNEIDKTQVSEHYIGKFQIPSTGANVACYASSSQATVDAQDSAAYFYGYGHTIIGDHNNQGFDSIKRCEVGTVAMLEKPDETITFYCVGKINGLNTGTKLTDENGGSIAELYPGTLVCYTCNDTWRNVTIVFFSTDPNYKQPNNDNGDQSNSTNDDQTQPSSPAYDCRNGYHCWGEWQLAWEVLEENGNYYGWDKRFCKICNDEDWIQRTEPSEQFGD